jgi:hypothetical protein
MKEAVTGDAKYQLGDVTKKKALEAMAEFTGKESYEFGDLSRKIAKLSEESKNTKGKQKKEPELHLQEQLVDELTEWDSKFQEQSGDKGNV